MRDVHGGGVVVAESRAEARPRDVQVVPRQGEVRSLVQAAGVLAGAEGRQDGLGGEREAVRHSVEIAREDDELVVRAALRRPCGVDVVVVAAVDRDHLLVLADGRAGRAGADDAVRGIGPVRPVVRRFGDEERARLTGVAVHERRVVDLAVRTEVERRIAHQRARCSRHRERAVGKDPVRERAPAVRRDVPRLCRPDPALVRPSGDVVGIIRVDGDALLTLPAGDGAHVVVLHERNGRNGCNRQRDDESHQRRRQRCSQSSETHVNSFSLTIPRNVQQRLGKRWSSRPATTPFPSVVRPNFQGAAPARNQMRSSPARSASSGVASR